MAAAHCEDGRSRSATARERGAHTRRPAEQISERGLGAEAAREEARCKADNCVRQISQRRGGRVCWCASERLSRTTSVLESGGAAVGMSLIGRSRLGSQPLPHSAPHLSFNALRHPLCVKWAHSFTALRVLLCADPPAHPHLRHSLSTMASTSHVSRPRMHSRPICAALCRVGELISG